VRAGHDRTAHAQVGAFFVIVLGALVPVVGGPAWKAATQDPDKQAQGSKAGFNKSGTWKQIDPKG